MQYTEIAAVMLVLMAFGGKCHVVNRLIAISSCVFVDVYYYSTSEDLPGDNADVIYKYASVAKHVHIIVKYICTVI